MNPITRNHLVTSLLACLAMALLAGCGGSEPQQKDKGFFTSGNREADQRADQRMANQKQMAGGSSGNSGATAGNHKSSDSGAIIVPEKRPLFDRLGGADGINHIVEDFVNRALADPRVNWSRAGVKRGGFSIHRGESEQWDASAANVQKLKQHMAQFLSVATGGPSTYTGKSMHDAHANMHISNPEFDAAMGDMKATLDKLQIANPEQKELLAVIESTREEIVEKR
ncbi:MAG TPA: group 1 truncated hemoglobin [Tepidisphaeraceae bacterium]|nr:group 1 truncated hemoglobin [Tepidisphaeraceae bacterium]